MKNEKKKSWMSTLFAYAEGEKKRMYLSVVLSVLSVAAGLRSKSFTLGCLSFAGCCVALTVLFLLKSSWLTEAFSAVVYYLTVAAVFLFFTAQGLEKSRWN